MLKVKIDVTFDPCVCTATLTDITGFQRLGFLSPDEEEREHAYKIHEFVSFVALGKITDDCYNLLNEPEVIHIPEEDVSNTFRLNFDPVEVKLSKDGHLDIGKYYVVTKDVFDAKFADTDNDYVYYDLETETFTYRVSGCVKTSSTPAILFKHLDVELTTGIYLTNLQFVSACHLEKCYNSMLKQNFGNMLGKNPLSGSKRCFAGDCSEADDTLKANIDLLRKSLAIVEYLIECDELDDAGYIIDLLGNCNGICSKVEGYDNCGCSN